MPTTTTYTPKYTRATSAWKSAKACKGYRKLAFLPINCYVNNYTVRPHGYVEATHTPGIWKHVSRPISFTLVVDDFGIKYEGKEHAQHLIETLQKYYTVEIDWEGSLYCGIQLRWNYAASNRHLDVSVPKFVPNKLHEFKHPKPAKPQHAPHPAPEIRYGRSAQEARPPDTTPPLDATNQKRIQKVVGSFLWYGRAVDTTILKALNSLSRQQAAPTETTKKHTDHLLDYLATHPDATIRYYPSDMILKIHSDASYLNEPGGRSTASGHFFLGFDTPADQPVWLNGAVHTLCTVLKHVAASAAEAELGALFLNTKEAKILRITLIEMGHPQPPTPIICDNSTATGISNNTVKRQRSRAMEMRYFWVTDQVRNKSVSITWRPGSENLGDYVTKHHPAKHHQHVRPLSKSQTILTSHDFKPPRRPARKKPRPKHPMPKKILHQQRLAFVVNNSNKQMRPRVLPSTNRTSVRPPPIKLYQPTLFQLQAYQKPPPEILDPPD